MPTPRAVATRYAEALLSLARETQDHDVWLRELERVQELLADPTVGQVLLNPALPRADRAELLASLLPGLRDQTRRFLALLVERGRLGLVPEIREVLQRLVDEERGIVTARVISAAPLDERQREIVAARLSDYTGKRVRLETSVDPELIGGLVALIGDERIDDSVRGRLQRLKQRLAQVQLS